MAMENLDKLNNGELKEIKVSAELVDLLKMTQDEGNEYLSAHVDAVVEAMCYIASQETIIDDEQSKMTRFTIIKDLTSLRELLKKLGETATIYLMMLLDPEILTNLYDFGDIYIN